MFKIVVFAIAFLSASNTLAQQKNWTAVKTDIRFYIRNAGLEVEGKFDQVQGTFVTDERNLPVLVVGTAKVKSIDTGIGLRDSHLQGKDYFNAAAFPELRMQLLSVTEKTIKFNVTIKGKSKTYEMPYVWKVVKEQGQFSVSFKLNRRDFGVGGSSLMLSDDLFVKIDLMLQP
ncbi:MAG: YceI family protein [Sphingobacteriaceae bacterium]|nr:YceI family protein [Sphingobacteriaceae bacterium]